MTTTTTYRTALEAKVVAVNRANEQAAVIHSTLADIVRPFVGQKIETATGDLTAKLRKLLPELPNSPSLRVYRYHSPYSLAWVVKTCVQYSKNFCIYHETTLYIGDLEAGVLKVVHELGPPLRTDYTVGEVLSSRAKYEAAKRAADAARDALYPFGEYDR